MHAMRKTTPARVLSCTQTPTAACNAAGVTLAGKRSEPNREDDELRTLLALVTNVRCCDRDRVHVISACDLHVKLIAATIDATGTQEHG